MNKHQPSTLTLTLTINLLWSLFLVLFHSSGLLTGNGSSYGSDNIVKGSLALTLSYDRAIHRNLMKSTVLTYNMLENADYAKNKIY